MKQQLSQLGCFILLITLFFIPNYAWSQFQDTLLSPNYFQNKYGKTLESKSDSIIDYYEESIATSEIIGDTITHLEALINLSILYRIIKDNYKYLDFLVQAEEYIAVNKINSQSANYRIANSYARYHFSKGNYLLVIDYCSKALDINFNNSIEDKNKLVIIYDLMSTSYIYIQEFDSALIYVNKSDSLLKLIPNHNFFYTLNNAWKKGSVIANSGDLRNALNYLLNSVNTIDKNNYNYQVAQIYFEIANIYFSLRELDKSIQYYEQTIEVYRLLNLPHYPYTIITYSAMARASFRLGRNKNALKLLTECVEYGLRNNDPNIMRYYQIIGAIYLNLDSLNLADNYFRKSLKLSTDKDQSWSLLTQANIKFYYGHFLIERLLDSIGVTLTEEAVLIYKNLFGNKHPRLADCYDYLGKAKILIDENPDEALKYFQKALIANDKTFNNSDINANPKLENALSKKFLLTILTDKADALKARTKKQLSVIDNIADIELMNKTLLLAINTIDHIRTSFTSVDSKLKMNEKTESLYSKLISSSIDLYNVTNDNKHLYNAYEYTEKSKLATLNGLINDDKAKITADVPEELLAKEKDLRIKKGDLNNQLYNLEQSSDIDENKKDKITKELFETDQEIDLLTADLERNYKNYYNLKYKNERLDVVQLQKKLSNEQVVLEYFLTDTIIFGFAITKDSFKLITTKIDTNFRHNITVLSSIFKKESYLYFDEIAFNSFKEKAHMLHAILIEPLGELLKGKELIIIPDKELLQLPFEILLANPADNFKNYRNLPYLIHNHPISYSYSSEWLFNKRTAKKASKNLLAIIPSYNTNVDYEDMVQIENKRKDIDVLLPLPAALDEAKSILKSIDGEILESEQATETKFKEMAKQYSILHFAMHTIIDNNNPMFSKLVFTPSENDTLNGEDNLLNTYEIFNLELNAQMVVLSSCKSGFGNIQKGEGIMSMARGFIFAGCPSLTITLWSIDDKASADLMSFYYQNLADGLNKAKALQVAKKDFLKSADPIRVHPHFWASHIIIGNTEKLHLNDNKTLIFLLLISIILTIGIIFRKRIIRV